MLAAALFVGLSGEEDRPATPAATVEAYLRALAEGDARTARAMAAPQTDTRFLTDAVVRAQREASPITGIDVRPPSSSDENTDEKTTVRATYRMGSEQVDTQVETVPVSGGWAVRDGAVAVRIESVWLPRPTLFDADIAAGDRVLVFPGPLEWGSRDTDFRGRTVGDEFPRAPREALSVEIVGELSATGTTAVNDAVARYLTRCAGSTQADAGTDRPGCTQRLFRSAVPGSVQWTTSRDLSGLRYTVREQADGSEPGMVDIAGSVPWRVAYTPNYDSDGPRVQTTDAQYLVGSVDLTDSEPEFDALNLAG